MVMILKRLPLLAPLTALALIIALSASYAAEWTRAPAQPPSDPCAKPPEKGVANTGEQKVLQGSQFGLAHDFGKVKYGTIVKHQFPLINTSGGLLKVVSVRGGGSPLKAWMSRPQFQHGEQSILEVNWDTRYFYHRKTAIVFVILDDGRVQTEIRFYVTVDSQKNP